MEIEGSDMWVHLLGSSDSEGEKKMSVKRREDMIGALVIRVPLCPP